MKTRFDGTERWQTSDGESLLIRGMDTSHLMNIVRMFIQKPNRTVSMLVDDINNLLIPVQCWTADEHNNEVEIKKQSIYNVTSMTNEQLIDYALNSPLGQRLMYELTERGVNIENMRNIWEKEIVYKRNED